MNRLTIYPLMAAALSIGASAAFAQTTTTTAPTVTAATTPPSPAPQPPPPQPPTIVAVAPPPAPHPTMGTMSPGGGKIAQALFDAQQGPVQWSMGKILAERQEGEGWGQVFHEMRAAGVIQAKSLGQVIRHSEIQGIPSPAAVHEPHDVVVSHHDVIITTASGSSHSLSLVGHSHDAMAAHESASAATHAYSGHAFSEHAAPVTIGAAPTAISAMGSQTTTFTAGGHGGFHGH